MKSVGCMPVILATIMVLSGCKKEDPATLPSLSTTTASNITAITATSGGSILDDGGATITANGVCWSLNPTPSTTESKTTDQVGTAQFTSAISGLSPGTTYHVRAYATNSVGTAYGADISFLTLGQAPSGLTQIPTNITFTGATLNGTVNPNDLSTTVTFEYGTTTGYGSTATATQSPISGNTMVNVSAEISGLIPGTTYHFRVKTVNSIGTTYGEDKTFTTPGQAPTATTTDATNKTTTGATLNGNVNANNSSTIITFEYGTTTSYGQTATASPSPVTSTSTTNVSAAITGLTAGTTYHFRVKAVNSIGTTHGNDMTFTTTGLPPTAMTLDATNKTVTGSTLNASVNANNSSTVVTFEYGTTTGYGQTVIASQSPVTGSNNTNVSASITGLTEGTTYHFRVKTVNSVGTIYGADKSFTTPYSPPPTSGLIAYYPFSGNANDESGNNINGIVSGATLSSDRFNTPNRTYTFDGVNDFIQIPDNVLFNSDNITISMWAKIERQNTTTQDLFMINKQGNSNLDIQWRIYHQGTSPTVDSTSLISDLYSSTGSRFIAGKHVITQVWHNIIVTINDSQINLFINGELMSSTPISGTLRKTNNGVTIGARIINGIAQSFYFGQIDDVRFYNRVITNNEIQELFHEGGW